MFSVMLFLFLFFLGIVAIFYYLLRRQDELGLLLREDLSELRVLLRALESRMNQQAGHANASGRRDEYNANNSENPSQTDADIHDPLLRLSFDEPASKHSGAAKKHDPALELHFDPTQGSSAGIQS